MNEMQRRWAEWFVLRALQAAARSRSEYERRTAELYDLARRHPNRFVGYYLTSVLEDLRIEDSRCYNWPDTLHKFLVRTLFSPFAVEV